MLHVVAAQETDLAFRIEQGEIDRGLEAVQARFILGVEKTGIAHRQKRDSLAPLDASPFERDTAVADKLRQEIERFRLRQQHRMAEVFAGDGIAEKTVQQQSLIDFVTVLLGLHEGLLARQRLRVRDEAGRLQRRGGDEFVDAREAAPVVGEPIIEFTAMRVQEIDARRSRRCHQGFRRSRRLGVSLHLGR